MFFVQEIRAIRTVGIFSVATSKEAGRGGDKSPFTGSEVQSLMMLLLLMFDLKKSMLAWETANYDPTSFLYS